MMTKLFVPGLRVVDKLNPEDNYEIISVANRKAIAAFVDKETNELVREKTITLTKENSITVRYLSDCNVAYPKPEGYYLSNEGDIMKDGKKVTEQGQLKVKEILGSIPGKLVLAVKAKNQDDVYADLYTYDLRPSYNIDDDIMEARDVFKKISLISFPNIKKIREEDDIILSFEKVRTEEITDDKDNVTEREFLDSAGLIRIDNKGKISIRELLFVPENAKILGDNILFEVSKEAICDGDREECDDCSETIYKKELTEVEPYTIVCDNFFNLTLVNLINIKRIDNISGNITYESDSNILSLIGSRTLIFKDNVFEELKGMSYIDTSLEGNKALYYYASKEREVKTVTVETTVDRGRIITVK